MPTLTHVDGFEHRELSSLRFGGANETGIWHLITDATQFSFVAGRTGLCLRCVENGTASRLARKGVVATNQLVLSFYLRVPSAPSVDSRFFDILDTGSVVRYRFHVRASDGALLYGNADLVGPVVTDGAQHRIDLHVNSSANPWVLKVSVDGAVQTDHSLAIAAGSVNRYGFGSDGTSHTLTFEVDDLVSSVTPADHPIGPHKVLAMHVNGDGTHVISGAGDFDKGDGTDILVSTTDAWTEIDDWITGVADTTTYVQDTAGAVTEYTEHTFDDTTEGTIWAVVGFAAAFSANAQACLLTVRIVDSDGATVADIVPNIDVSETVLHYRTAGIQQNPTQAQVNAYKVRIGLSTDVAPDPRCSAVMLQYAVPEAAAEVPTLPWDARFEYDAEIATWA